MEAIEKTELEEVQDEQGAPSVSVEADAVSVEGSGELHAALGDMADSFDVSGFKCTKCGLAHMHDTTKHRTSDSSGVTESDAAGQDYNPNCHCGYNEAAHTGLVDASPESAANTAPIPDETAREMQANL